MVKEPHVDPGGEAHSSLASSLLQRLQEQDPRSWERLDRLYGPVVLGWCLRAGLRQEDAADVGQEVFQAVAGAIGEFRRDRPGDSFRGWLWTVTRRKILDHQRRSRRPQAAGGTTAQERLAQLAAADDASELAPPPDQGEVGAVYCRALELIQAEFAERTWRAFWGVAVDGLPAGQVAAPLGMTAGAVYIAKSRVLRRLREEFGELI
jgi:RNA polymerase sigma-70 factor (ECF subfamily)